MGPTLPPVLRLFFARCVWFWTDRQTLTQAQINVQICQHISWPQWEIDLEHDDMDAESSEELCSFWEWSVADKRWARPPTLKRVSPLRPDGGCSHVSNTSGKSTTTHDLRLIKEKLRPELKLSKRPESMNAQDGNKTVKITLYARCNLLGVRDVNTKEGTAEVAFHVVVYWDDWRLAACMETWSGPMP